MRYVLTVEIREKAEEMDDLIDIVEEYEYYTEAEAKADAEAVLRNAKVIHADKLEGDQYIYLAMMEYNEDDSISWVDELEEINKED